MDKEDRVKGALYGFAIGDAMGATTEFMAKEEIERKYGKVEDMIGGGWLGLKAGECTDDTDMTLCVIDALMNPVSNSFKNDVMDNFVAWYNSGPQDIGNQCRLAIQYYIDKGEFIYRDEDACGNGTLMRALPCALIGDIDSNVEQGIATHNSSTCSKIIREYSKHIQSLIDNGVFSSDIHATHLQPTGYVVNTYNNALYWSSLYSLEDAIVNAVNDGGDADTIAAITGSLSGARYGYSSIPRRWIDTLDSGTKKKLDEFSMWCIEKGQRNNLY